MADDVDPVDGVFFGLAVVVFLDQFRTADRPASDAPAAANGSPAHEPLDIDPKSCHGSSEPN